MALNKRPIKRPAFNLNPHLIDDFDSDNSQCDYNSDVFKEQPSYFGNCNSQPNHAKEKENHQDGGYSANNFGKILKSASPGLQHINKGSRQEQIDSQGSLRINLMPVQNQNKVSIGPKSIKNSCEQSLNIKTPNYKQLQTANSTANKNSKKPFYSMIPNQMSKNLNKEAFQYKEESSHIKLINSNQKNSVQQNPITALLSQQELNQKPHNMYCEESEILMFAGDTNSLKQNQNSMATITPQKNMPLPISASEQPLQTTCSRSCRTNYPQNKIQQALQQSTNKHISNSGQKTPVIYDEFKYYTSNQDLPSAQNAKKQVSNGLPRQSDISNSNPQPLSHQNLHFELSPTDHKIFDLSSPKSSLTGLGLRALAKQINGGEQNQKFYQPKKETKLSVQQNESENALVKELKEQIVLLESNLKKSQLKNVEMKKRFKDKSMIQSFERNKKHLSDTEDSLVLSEKKGKKRNSNSKTGLNTSISNNNNQNYNSVQAYHSNSSIVDVKIRPITNQKSECSKSKASPSFVKNQQSKKNNYQTDELSNNLDYQVQDFADHSPITNPDHSHNEDQDSQVECEGCERLKQLVFQAKEAIDDLKLEIEEWRDICSEKETELRQLQHKIYNDIAGVDKKTQFSEEVHTKEFDLNKPVSTDCRKIRNFVQHNKKRIRSRSKTSQKQGENTFSCRKTSVSQSTMKKSLLKNVKDLMNEDQEFYEAEDQAIQTSYQGQCPMENITNVSQDNDQVRALNGITNQYKTSSQCYVFYKGRIIKASRKPRLN